MKTLPNIPPKTNRVWKNCLPSEGVKGKDLLITDGAGHAYLTNTGVDLTFSPDHAKQPQASAFWTLIDGSKKIVIQEPRKREIDDRVFKYVGVSGVDKRRIIQVGVSEKNCLFASEHPGHPARGPRAAARAPHGHDLGDPRGGGVMAHDARPLSVRVRRG